MICKPGMIGCAGLSVCASVLLAISHLRPLACRGLIFAWEGPLLTAVNSPEWGRGVNTTWFGSLLEYLGDATSTCGDWRCTWAFSVSCTMVVERQTEGPYVRLSHFCVSTRFIQKPESLDINACYSPSPVPPLTLNVLALTFRSDQALFLRVICSF